MYHDGQHTDDCGKVKEPLIKTPRAQQSVLCVIRLRHSMHNGIKYHPLRGSRPRSHLLHVMRFTRVPVDPQGFWPSASADEAQVPRSLLHSFTSLSSLVLFLLDAYSAPSIRFRPQGELITLSGCAIDSTCFVGYLMRVQQDDGTCVNDCRIPRPPVL